MLQTVFIFAEHTKSLGRGLHQEYPKPQFYLLFCNESFENVAKFKYLRTALTNQNDIHTEIKNRLNSGNSCAVWVRNWVYHFERRTQTIFLRTEWRRIFGPKRE
jgi:hypothetical protein